MKSILSLNLDFPASSLDTASNQLNVGNEVHLFSKLTIFKTISNSGSYAKLYNFEHFSKGVFMCHNKIHMCIINTILELPKIFKRSICHNFNQEE